MSLKCSLMYCHMTDFPKLFKDSYWGNFQQPDKTDRWYDNVKEIAKNRNKFAIDYQLKSYSYPADGRLDEVRVLDERKVDMRDHNEYYKDTYKRIIALFSKYCSEELEKLAIASGYEKYPYPLYQQSQTTFIKVLPSTKPKKNKYPDDLKTKMMMMMTDKNMHQLPF